MIVIIILVIIIIIIITHFVSTEFFTSPPKLLVWGWAINKDRQKMEAVSKTFLESGKHYSLHTKLIGIGVDYAKWDAPVVNGDGSKAGHGLQRFYVLRDELKNVSPDQIVVVMDTADTLLAGNQDDIIQRFKKLNTRILISAEQKYTYQLMQYKQKYINNNQKTPYKYIAAGTFMGYARDLKKMVDDCIVLCCTDKNSDLWNRVEMAVLSAWVHKHLVVDQPKHTKALIRLDTNCDVFWVTTKDHSNFLKNLESPNPTFYNEITKTHPLILHLTEHSRGKILDALDKILTSK